MWHGKICYGKCYLVIVSRSSRYKIAKVVKLFKKLPQRILGDFLWFYNYHCLFCHSLCWCSFCASAGRKQVETNSCLTTIFINYFLINNAKTQTLPIVPCKYDFDLTLNGSGVTKLPSIRILGVELYSMLNFIEHISSQLKKGVCEDRRT